MIRVERRPARGCSADAASTHYALNHGAHEAVMSQSNAVNNGIMGGQMVAGAWALQRLYAKKPKTAIVLGIALGAFRASAAAHNMAVMGR